MTSKLDVKEEDQSSLDPDADAPETSGIKSLNISAALDDTGGAQPVVEQATELAYESSLEEDAGQLPHLNVRRIRRSGLSERAETEANTLPPPWATDQISSSAEGTATSDNIPVAQVSEGIVIGMRSIDESQISPRSSLSSGRPLSRGSISSSQTPASRPFDRRFHARSLSSAFLKSHSRQHSLSSQLTVKSSEEDEESQKPWDVVRWSKLKKITNQVFSEAGRRAFGSRTHLNVGASIAVGTSKGIILLFDYQQNLKSIIGQGTAAAECGSITALATSADHSTIAAGHANGSIFTWSITSPARPFLHIPPLPIEQVASRRSDVHISGHAVLHLGFLGARNTALVSADNSGMAFSHLATRGLGAVGRVVKSVRILGRYPEKQEVQTSLRKPTSVLAFAPLPLGNVAQVTDELGLTALLTPHLLVIVSTMPIAQTQFKATRSQKIAAHSAMTGCLAWFPAVQLRNKTNESTTAESCAKLVFCWSNVISVLEVYTESAENEEDKRPNLRFETRNQWKCDESIVTVQWLSRSVLAILTITQKLLILEDYSMRLSDSSDLNSKHIYHEDLFSRQLQLLVDKVEQEDSTLHGVVPDAYYMSFKAYKGRLFLLGMSDLAMGTLSNWADRLVALMEVGSLVDAISLATSYYIGDSDKITVGLPDDDELRHSKVKERLLQIISASLKYVFKADENDELESNIRIALQDLVEPIFKACLAMDEKTFLLEDVYEWYRDASSQDLILDAMEPRIIDGKLDDIPPDVLQDLINWFASHGLEDRLEAMICCLKTESMDIDRASTICKAYHLYDAFIYIWTQALGDYVTPMVELMVLFSSEEKPSHIGENESDTSELASKVFPYMAYTLTGRVYPRGQTMSPEAARMAQNAMYSFIFSSEPVDQTSSNSKSLSEDMFENEHDYPYLRALLHYDTASFMSMLNEGYEDGFLNVDQDQQPQSNRNYDTRISTNESFITRSRIITILLEVLVPPDFGPSERTYLNIFIARNLPKFPQFILLPGSVLHDVLTELCAYPSPEFAEECQLSVEYLLSYYHPSDSQSLIPLFQDAKFFRILKSTYKGLKQYANWVETYFSDYESRSAVFDCIVQCLQSGSNVSARQTKEVKGVIERHSQDLADIDVRQFAEIIREYAQDVLDSIINQLENRSISQYNFLRALLEPDGEEFRTNLPNGFAVDNTERYIKLMCKHEPQRVADYISVVPSSNLHLEPLLPIMEENGAVDAAVLLMAREGLVRDAMTRLTKHLGTLSTALVGLLEAGDDRPDPENTMQNVNELLDTIKKYTTVGTWLCQGSPNSSIQTPTGKSSSASGRSNELSETDLNLSELLWLELVDSIVSVSRAVPSLEEFNFNDSTDSPTKQATLVLRKYVQDIFTALLTASTSVATSDSITSKNKNTHLLPALFNQSTSMNNHKEPISFLSILRCFLTRASVTSPTLSELRSVLASIFSAYAFEESILQLSSSLIDKDGFAQVKEADRRRRMGWRPRSMACEGCKRRAWGPGAGVGHWHAWRERRAVKLAKIAHLSEEEASKGKGRANEAKSGGAEGVTDVEDGGTAAPDALVLFACYHVWHRVCLERALREAPPRHKRVESDAGYYDEAGKKYGQRYYCPLCVHSGASVI